MILSFPSFIIYYYHPQYVVSRLANHIIHISSPSPSPSLTTSVTSTFKPQLLLHYYAVNLHLSLLYATSSKMETNNKDLQLSNLFDVKGKVALVTGGGQSIPQSHLR